MGGVDRWIAACALVQPETFQLATVEDDFTRIAVEVPSVVARP
jgi:hypothetical protein